MRSKKSPASDHLGGANSAKNEVSFAGDTIDLIKYWHRQRCFAMEQRKRTDLSLGGFLRTALGWSFSLPDAERKAIAVAATLIMDDISHPEWGHIVAASQAARKPFEEIEARAVKEMKLLAMSLPVFATFVKGVRGFGAASLAVIVAEAGDLSNYATVAKLWKRMGLAVMGDVRQGGLPANAQKEDWIAHGYNPQRRSRVWNIGDSLIKGNRDGAYRTCYLARKQYEISRDPDIRPIKAHRRAQRYMEKRLLKHLWQAWRATIQAMPTISELSLSHLSRLPEASLIADGMPSPCSSLQENH